MSSSRLSGRIAVVTGAGSGMGRVIAGHLVAEGARVAVLDLDAEAVAETVRGIKAGDRAAFPFAVNVARDQEVAAVIRSVVEEFKHVDILVNCAAVTEFGPAEDIAAEKWQRMIDVDLTGVFYCCREAGRQMIHQRYGKIINFGSTAGLAGVPYMAHYTAAKHGVVGLTKALACEWGKYGINVNCICPGATETPMLLHSTTPEYRAERIARTPLNRLATPDDQARVVSFLASSDSDYMTGNIICTDGGIAALAASTSSAALSGAK